jgi:hypothetical protein
MVTCHYAAVAAGAGGQLMLAAPVGGTHWSRCHGSCKGTRPLRQPRCDAGCRFQSPAVLSVEGCTTRRCQVAKTMGTTATTGDGHPLGVCRSYAPRPPGLRSLVRSLVKHVSSRLRPSQRLPRHPVSVSDRDNLPGLHIHWIHPVAVRCFLADGPRP